LRTAPFNAMAFGGPFFNVKLLETDVPGAQLGENDFKWHYLLNLSRSFHLVLNYIRPTRRKYC